MESEFNPAKIYTCIVAKFFNVVWQRHLYTLIHHTGFHEKPVSWKRKWGSTWQPIEVDTRMLPNKNLALVVFRYCVTNLKYL